MPHGGAELTVRPARPEDRPRLVELLTLCLGEGSVPRTEEFWRWKHEANPFGPSPVLLAEVEGRIVGVRAFLRWRWRSGEREVPAVRAVDTATHPDWRGRGVFSRLTRRLLEDVAADGTAFVFNTPNRASGAGYRKLGWRPLGRAPVLMRPLAPVATVLRWGLGTPGGGAARRNRQRGGSGGGGPDALRARAPDLSAFLSVEELLEAPALDGLLEVLDLHPADRRYRTPLDRSYLRWRYADPPGLDYRALWSGGGGRAGAPAAVVFRGRRRGRFREVVVSEVLVPPGEAGGRAARELLRRLARSARRAGADYLAAVASRRTPERRALARSGFLPVPGAGPTVVVRGLGHAGALPDPAAASSWRWSGGSLEVF